MREIKQIYKKIYNEQKGLMLLMFLMTFLGLIVAIVMTVNLRPSGSVVKILYSDLQGYKDGGWRGLVVFPLMASLIAVMNNMLAAKLFSRKGKTFAKVLIGLSFSTVMILVIIFSRLSGQR